MDNLRQNAYGIYLVNCVFVIWLQYFLVRAAFAALAKGTVVFLGALGLSWASVAALRRFPGIAQIVCPDRPFVVILRCGLSGA